jgi:hypothetical protein
MLAVIHKEAQMKPTLRSGLIVVCLLALVGCGAAADSAQTAALRIVSPAPNATVKGPKVKVEVAADGFRLVAANQAPKAGEGHLHFFIDVPASSVAVGQAVPLDQASAYVHAGKEPFTFRELDLAPGKHTITVVAADAAHMVVGQPAPVVLELTVE